MKKPKIVIHVRGGVIQSVHANRSILYVIVDEDEPIAGGEKISDVYGEDSIFNENNFDILDSEDNNVINSKFTDIEEQSNNVQPEITLEQAIETMIKHGYIRHFWHEDDVRTQADNMDIELTDDQVNDVIIKLEDTDANTGINWDTIQIAINEVIENNRNDE